MYSMVNAARINSRIGGFYVFYKWSLTRLWMNTFRRRRARIPRRTESQFTKMEDRAREQTNRPTLSEGQHL